jgi:hypothetical protein
LFIKGHMGKVRVIVLEELRQRMLAAGVKERGFEIRRGGLNYGKFFF